MALSKAGERERERGREGGKEGNEICEIGSYRLVGIGILSVTGLVIFIEKV